MLTETLSEQYGPPVSLPLSPAVLAGEVSDLVFLDSFDALTTAQDTGYGYSTSKFCLVMLVFNMFAKVRTATGVRHSKEGAFFFFDLACCTGLCRVLRGHVADIDSGGVGDGPHPLEGRVDQVKCSQQDRCGFLSR